MKFPPHRLLLVILLALGLLVRLQGLTAPPLDFHATRQLRGVLIARGFYFASLPTLPELETRQAQARQFQNAMAQYEPPILEWLVSRAYSLSPLTPGEQEAPWVARLFTVSAWLLAGLAVYDLGRRLSSPAGGFFALGVYLFHPFGAIASRSFQPDPLMTALLVGSAWALVRWLASPPPASIRAGWHFPLLAGALAGAAVLLKPFIALVLGGMFAAGLLARFGLAGLVKNPRNWALAGLALLPGLAYYLGGLGVESTGYFTSWTLDLLHMAARPQFYIQWLLMLDEVVGFILLLLALWGMALAASADLRQRAWLPGLWLGYGLYGLALPYLITTHTYYSLPLIPLAALSLAPLGEWLAQSLAARPLAWRLFAAGVALAAVAFFAWQVHHSVEDAQEQAAWIPTWQEAAAHLPEDGRAIALTQHYGYPLMVYGWRSVELWPTTGEQALSALRGSSAQDVETRFAELTQGMRYFLVTDPDQLARQPALEAILFENYPLVSHGEPTPGHPFWIFDLAP